MSELPPAAAAAAAAAGGPSGSPAAATAAMAAELQDLFAYVQRYTPVEFTLDTRLQPFIPDFVPSLGGVDDQIKVPRPDGKPDFLGLTVLDEPALRQSDPALLALRLRHSLRTAAGRSSGGGSGGEAVEEAPLGWVPDPADQPAKVEGWCDAVAALHQGEGSAGSVGSELVDLEALAQPWPASMAHRLRSRALPDPKQKGVDLAAFARSACGLVDIPPGGNPLEALHTLFALYLHLGAGAAGLQRHGEAYCDLG